MNETTARRFHAQFQTFDETSDPAHGAQGSRRCGPNSKGAGWKGSSFRARTPSRTNTCRRRRTACLAHRLHRLAGRAIVLVDGPRSSSTAATPSAGSHAGRQQSFSASRIWWTIAPASWIEDNLKAARDSATTRGCTPRRCERWGRPAPRAGAEPCAVRANPIDAIWPDRPAPPHGAVVPHAAIRRRNGRRTSSSACAPNSRSSRPTRSWSPIRMRSPGCSISAAPTSPHTPIALAFASFPTDGERALYFDGLQADRSGDEALAASPRRVPRPGGDIAALGAAKGRRTARSSDRREASSGLHRARRRRRRGPIRSLP